MAQSLFTVEQAAQELNLHPKTVLRYIRDGRLTAKRVGKSYRILRADLDAFAGLASGRSDTDSGARTTCITDLSGITIEAAARIANFLQAAAMTGDAGTPPLHLQTVFDPHTQAFKIVMIGSPSDVSTLLEMLHLHIKTRP